MDDWYFGTPNKLRPQAWQERTRNTMDHRLEPLHIVPPPTPGGPPTNMPTIPLLAVASAFDAPTIGFRRENPYERLYEHSATASLLMRNSYPSALLQAQSRMVPDLLGSRRPTPPEPPLSVRFPPEFHSAGLQGQGELSQELTEGARQKKSRASPGSANAAAAPLTIAIPNSTSTASTHGSCPPRFQRRPTPPTTRPNNPQYIEPPPGFHYRPSPSQSYREQCGLPHFPSRHGPSVAGGIQASSSIGGGNGDRGSRELCEAILAGAARLARTSRQRDEPVFDVSSMGQHELCDAILAGAARLARASPPRDEPVFDGASMGQHELCEAILAGAARLAHASPLTAGPVFDGACMWPNATLPVQTLDTFAAMASGRPYPTPFGRSYSWDRHLAEASFQRPVYEATSVASRTTAHPTKYQHVWIPVPSQVPPPDPVSELWRNKYGFVSWSRLRIHEAESDDFGDNEDSCVRQSERKPCPVCGKVHTHC